MNKCCQDGGKATQWTADPFHPGSIPGLGLEFFLDIRIMKQSDSFKIFFLKVIKKSSNNPQKNPPKSRTKMEKLATTKIRRFSSRIQQEHKVESNS